MALVQEQTLRAMNMVDLTTEAVRILELFFSSAAYCINGNTSYTNTLEGWKQDIKGFIDYVNK
tara:strand:- start:330 stop:518 length:189 start_codon:yes stop_codon:yes gene_type:complete